MIPDDTRMDISRKLALVRNGLSGQLRSIEVVISGNLDEFTISPWEVNWLKKSGSQITEKRRSAELIFDPRSPLIGAYDFAIRAIHSVGATDKVSRWGAIYQRQSIGGFITEDRYLFLFPWRLGRFLPSEYQAWRTRRAKEDWLTEATTDEKGGGSEDEMPQNRS